MSSATETLTLTADERNTLEAYARHGTLSLYAALDPGTGTVVGQTAACDTSADFVQFAEVEYITTPCF